MEITFEKLPQAVTQLLNKLENLEQLIISQKDIPQRDEDQLLTIREAAEILHLSVPTVYGLVQRSEVPVCKRGKRLYFSKTELITWVKTGRKKTQSEIDMDAESYIKSASLGRRCML